MKNLVIIGANNFQLPLIKKAKSLGFTTHVFAWEYGAVGKDYSDYFYPISIIEKELILKEAEKINPLGIISIGSDLASITVNFIADKLGLIGNSMNCTYVTTNKYAMRHVLFENGLPCPDFIKTKNFQEICTLLGSFPLIVKPTDRSGSRGVTKVNNAKDLERAIIRAESESFSSEFIVEQFITGKEYSVEMISWKGDHHFLQFTEKETTGEPYFVEIGQHQPANLSSSIKERIISIVKKSLTCLGVEYGASHSEILIDKNDGIYITEIGARMGGDFIGSHLVELSTGYDYLKNTIDVATGNFNEVKLSLTRYSGVYYVLGKPGTIKNIVNNSKNHIDIVFSEVYKKVGDRSNEVKESNDRSACYVYQSLKEKFPLHNKIIYFE